MKNYKFFQNYLEKAGLFEINKGFFNYYEEFEID